MAFSLIPLGKTDVRVPPIGIGTWAWGDQSLWQFGNGYGEADVRAAFDASLQAGIDFFDTAEIYGRGQSERFLGRFVHAAGRPVLVATKFMPFPWRLRRKELVEALRKSLDRLGLDRVDLYQIHMPLPPISVETWMDGLADAVQAGLVRAVGVSNYSAAQTRRAHAALARHNIPLASNQIEYHLLHRNPEQNGVLQACRELDVRVIAYSPIAKGLLSGKYTPDRLPGGLRRRMTSRNTLTRIQPLIERMRVIGDAHGAKTPAQVALNWLMAKGTLPIPGAKNAAQAVENIGAAGWALTPAEVAELDAASESAAGRKPI